MNKSSSLATVADRDFKTLVEELELIDLGPAAEREASNRRRDIEGHLIRLLSTGVEQHERRECARVPCDLWVQLNTGQQTKPGVIDDIGLGGIFVSTLLAAKPGDQVTVHVGPRPGLLTDPLDLIGRVAWAGKPKKRQGIGICFDAHPSRERETQLRKLVTTLLRRLVPAELT